MKYVACRCIVIEFWNNSYIDGYILHFCWGLLYSNPQLLVCLTLTFTIPSGTHVWRYCVEHTRNQKSILDCYLSCLEQAQRAYSIR